MMNPTISHDRQEETLTAKAAWFQSLSLSERMDLLCFFTDLILDNNPIDVQTSTPGLEFETAWQNRETMTYQGQQFHVVSKSDLIAAKRATGRQVDLDDVALLELH